MLSLYHDCDPLLALNEGVKTAMVEFPPPSPLSPRTQGKSGMDIFLAKHAVPLRIVLLHQEHINQVMQLREQVFATLTHPDCYVRENDEYEFIKQQCGIIGETFGVFSADRRLVAYASLSYQSTLDKENLGFITGLSAELYDQVSQLASCMVAPDFQGLGLHKILVKKRIALAHKRGYPHCLSLVSPYNTASRHNLFQSGFQIHWAGTLPGLSTQHILYYNTRQPPLKLETQLTECVDSTNITRQQRLLQQGYYGYADARPPQQGLLFAPLLSS